MDVAHSRVCFFESSLTAPALDEEEKKREKKKRDDDRLKSLTDPSSQTRNVAYARRRHGGCATDAHLGR
jgi:hypothetical protein